MPASENDLKTPTMLIGLGGLGCSIVQHVFDGLDETSRKFARAHVLDTDSADIGDARFERLRASRWQTQTSRATTVRECIDQLGVDKAARKWFPSESAGSLMHKQMTKGAAMVRSISRLAWLDTLGSSRIDALNANLDGLFRTRIDGVAESARVLIVNSLAGGTGTGLFLQMALYVREYLKSKGVTAITIRGFAVMPAVFISNGDYEADDLRSNVKANGYAVLKELDALVRLRAGAYRDPALSHAAPLYDMELEYVPGHLEAAKIADGVPPFDVVTLFDFTNNAGANLGSKSNYIAQVQDAMRLHLFSPLAGRGGPDSQEDNLALTYLATGDRGRYAGCGTSNVVYPFEDLVEYGALRWASDGISTQWMEIDRLIKEEIRNVTAARKEGSPIEMPDPRVRFGELLRDKAQGKRPSPFYKGILQEAHLVDEKGNQIIPKHEAWLEALEKKAREMTKAAIDEKAGVLSTLSMEALKDRDNVVSQVERSEEGLRHYEREVEKRVQPIGSALAKDAFWLPFDRKIEFDRGNDIQINTWMLARSAPMHPLAMRYFLSESWVLLSERVAHSTDRLKEVNDQIDGYDQIWDDPSTEVVETAVDAAIEERDSWRSRLPVVGSLKKFAEDYASHSEIKRTNIERRAELYVLLELQSYLLSCVEDLAEGWSEWFSSLEDVIRSAGARVSQLETSHERSDDPTRVYVHATSTLKRKLWDDQSSNLMREEFPPKISKTMYLAMYRRIGEEVRDGKAIRRDAGWVQALFDESVLSWCREKIRATPAFDMNVSEAIKAEWRAPRDIGGAGHEGKEVDALIRYLRKLENLATPWIDSGGAGQQFSYLCMHPAVSGAWDEKVLNQHADKRNVNEGFSRHAISRMVVRQGFMATALRSMVGEHATYRSAYNERIRRSRSRPATAVTPHLDVRWDSPAFLPELDDNEQARAIKDIYRAALWTLAMDGEAGGAHVFRLKLDMLPVWGWSPVRGTHVALHDKDGHVLREGSFQLVDALAVNYSLVGQILRDAAEREHAARANVADLPIVKKHTSLVDALAKVRIEASSSQVGFARQVTLLQTLFDEIRALHVRAMDGPQSALYATKAALADLFENSKILAEDPSGDFADVVRRCLATALED